MQRNFQLLFFVAIISVALASQVASNGCIEGKSYSQGCVRCYCDKGVPRCVGTKPLCDNEGSPSDFYSYPEVPEPPRADDVINSRVVGQFNSKPYPLVRVEERNL